MSGHRQAASKRYVIVTAAYNEEAFIEKTIAAVAAQTLLPEKWVIVSDASTDRTDEIVRYYSNAYDFIHLLRITEEHPRHFAAQVHAINLGCKYLRNRDYRFIANLDADVSFEPTYYERLLARFDNDPTLGVGGGFIYEKRGKRFQSRRLNSQRSVAHAVQMFRRECFESIGGYLALPYGGPDWHALVNAQLHGWRVAAFPDLHVVHYRSTGSADKILHHWFRQGRMDYSMGCGPLFEMVRLGRRIPSKPYLLGSLIRLAGFLYGYCQREPRPVSPEFIKFLRRDEHNRLVDWVHLPLLKKLVGPM